MFAPIPNEAYRAFYRSKRHPIRGMWPFRRTDFVANRIIVQSFKRAMAGWLCANCDNEGEVVDHIVPIAVGYYTSEDALIDTLQYHNLQWLCKPCHKVKTATDKGVIAEARRTGCGWKR